MHTHIINMSRHNLSASAVETLSTSGYSVDPTPLSPKFRDRDEAVAKVLLENEAGIIPVLTARADFYLAIAAAGGRFFLLGNAPAARLSRSFRLNRITLVSGNTLTDIPLVNMDSGSDDLAPAPRRPARECRGYAWSTAGPWLKESCKDTDSVRCLAKTGQFGVTRCLCICHAFI